MAVDTSREAGETPMQDHIDGFWDTLKNHTVGIGLDIRRELGDGTVYHDGSRFNYAFSKALLSERDALRAAKEKAEQERDVAQETINRWKSLMEEAANGCLEWQAYGEKLERDADAALAEEIQSQRSKVTELRAEHAAAKERLAEAEKVIEPFANIHARSQLPYGVYQDFDDDSDYAKETGLTIKRIIEVKDFDAARAFTEKWGK